MPQERAPVGDPEAYQDWADNELAEAEKFYDQQEGVTADQATTSPVLVNDDDGWGDAWGDDDSGSDTDGSD